MQTIKEETDGLHEELEFIRLLGTDLIFACGETEKPEVKKSIDEVGKAAASYSHRMREELAWKSLTSFVGNLLQMNNAWENLNKTWKDLSQPFKVGSGRLRLILFFVGRMCMIFEASDCLLLHDPRNPSCKPF